MVAACPFPTSQGSQTLVRQLATGLTLRGHTVELVVYHTREHDVPLPFRVHRGPRLPLTHRLRAGPSAGKVVLDVGLLARALAVGRATRPHVIHGHNYEGALVGAVVARALRVPLVYHSHNVLQEELPTYYQWRWLGAVARALGTVVDESVPSWADAVVALHEEVKRRLVGCGVRQDRIWVIPPGIWPEEWPEPAQVGIPGRVVYTGNLDPYQNLAMLVEAMGVVIREVPTATLAVVSHQRSAKLERMVRRLGLGECTEFVVVQGFEAVRRWIYEASVAVCTRLPACGYPIKLVNYLAAGRPVVVSEACAHGVAHGVTGLVVREQTPAAFADAVVRLLRDRDLALRLGMAAREWALAHLSWPRLLGEMETVYQSVA